MPGVAGTSGAKKMARIILPISLQHFQPQHTEKMVFEILWGNTFSLIPKWYWVAFLPFPAQRYSGQGFSFGADGANEDEDRVMN